MDREQLRAASDAIREKAQKLDRDLNALIAEFRRDTGCDVAVAEMVPLKDSYTLKFKVTV